MNHDQYRDLHSKVSPTTAHHSAFLLHAALKRAVRLGVIAQNPCDIAEPPRRNRPEPVMWTKEQVTRFLSEAQGSRYRLFYGLLVGTGMRVGEALALTWHDIDFGSGTLHVPHGKTTSSRRTIALPQTLVRELQEVRGIGLVFHSHGGPIDPRNIRRYDFLPMVKRLGLPRIRLHDLRHFHASFLLARGADLASVSSRLGHGSKSFTLSTYAHTMTSGRELAEDVDELLAICWPKAPFAKTEIPAVEAGNMVEAAGIEFTVFLSRRYSPSHSVHLARVSMDSFTL